MAVFLIPAFGAAILLQAVRGPHAPEPMPTTTSDLAIALEQSTTLQNEFFELMGTCEARLPASLVSVMTYPFSPEALTDATDEAKARVAASASAYATGRASPRAASVTQEQCNAELADISTEMEVASGHISNQNTAGH